MHVAAEGNLSPSADPLPRTILMWHYVRAGESRAAGIREHTNCREHANLPMWLLVIIFNAGLMSDPRRNLYLAHSPVRSSPSQLAFEEADREWNRIIIPWVCRELPWWYEMWGKKLGYSWIALWKILGLAQLLLSFFFCKCLILAPSFM